MKNNPRDSRIEEIKRLLAILFKNKTEIEKNIILARLILKLKMDITKVYEVNDLEIDDNCFLKFKAIVKDFLNKQNK